VDWPVQKDQTAWFPFWYYVPKIRSKADPLIISSFAEKLHLRNNLLSLFFIALCFATAEASYQKPELRIGDAAPAIKVEKSLQVPDGRVIDLAALRDQVVVVEFWATWCSPCIPAIAHLNSIAEKFKDQPVAFLSITDEDDPKLIQEFLKKRPIKGWIGLDTDGSAFKSYGVVGRPNTFLIDKRGTIAAITDAEKVTASVIEDLLAGKSISLPVKVRVADDLDWNPGNSGEDENILQVAIKPSQATTSGVYIQQRRITADGVPLITAISTAYKMPGFRIINLLPAEPQKHNLKISVTVPTGRETELYPLFQKSLESAFGFTVSREMRELDVFELVVAKTEPKQLTPSTATQPMSMFARGKILGAKQQISNLAEILSGVLNRPVLNETGIEGEFDWELPYSRVDSEMLLTALREKLGLELIARKKSLEVLIVKK
jgi:uncharacterized protein (TIGR03435 family)